MTFRVYQIMIDDAKHTEVNEKGWDGVEWGKSYTNLTFGSTKEKDPWIMILAGIHHDLIRHTRTIETDDIDEVFSIGNGHGDLSLQTVHGPAKSISVGDILVDTETHVGHMVDNFGFIGISPQNIRKMETIVIRKENGKN